MKVDTDQLLAEIDAVLKETMASYGDHDPAEARRVALANADRLRALSERQNP